MPAALPSADPPATQWALVKGLHLKIAGSITGDKRGQAVFTRIDRLSHSALHAEGYYGTADGEKKAYLHIGPKFGTVSKQAVTEAIKACRDRRDPDWLVILGFAFEPGLHDTRKDLGTYQVSVVRMHDVLLQQGLLKKDKKSPASSPSASRTSA